MRNDLEPMGGGGLQPALQRDADLGAGAACTDGAELQPTALPNRLERDPTTGRFMPGNPAAVGHGLYTERDLAQLNAEVTQFLAGCVSDDGGEENIPTRRRADLEYRARLHRRIVQLDNALEAKGLFDRRGKLRVGWLSLLATLIDRAKALDAMLGLQRKARAVNFTERLAEALARTGEQR